MSRSRAISRRQFGAGAAATAALSVLPSVSTLAQTGAATTGVSANPWQELGALSARARELKLSVPRMSLGLTGGTSFSDVMPAVSAFLDHAEASAATSTAPPSDVEALLNRASDLLIAVTSAERAPRNGGGSDEPGIQATANTFEALRDGYLKLFDSCKIDDSHRATVNWYVGKLTDQTSDQSYDTVEDAICAPWYFIGIIHGLEASFNFRAHLHNGDPLTAKTKQVPAGRPLVWLPPSDWASSAEDALTLEHYDNQPDWSLARLLYRFEAYNGFGSRAHGINTPYLWAFSNQYAKGKYVSDGKWNPDAVSQQCGAAVMLKALIESGRVSLPS